MAKATNLMCLLALTTASCGGSIRPVGSLSDATGELRDEHDAARLRLLDDYQQFMGPFELKLRRGRASVEVPAEVGWCYAYFATASRGVRDLDMEVLHQNGRVAGTDSMFDATPYVQHCADDPETMTVTLNVARGGGTATFSVLRKPD